MNRLILSLILVLVSYAYVQLHGIPFAGEPPSAVRADTILLTAWDNQQSGFQVEGRGMVIKLLPDDREGSRHQKFIIRLDSGQTLLVSHNIDLARRISALRSGDPVEFYGQYEWSREGGVIHWTHRDPNGYHVGGWLKHMDVTYQ